MEKNVPTDSVKNMIAFIIMCIIITTNILLNLLISNPAIIPYTPATTKEPAIACVAPNNSISVLYEDNKIP